MTDNPWKDAVLETLVTRHIYKTKHEHYPRDAINDLISYDVEVALNPAVSSAAAALVEQGRLEERQAWLDHLEGKQIA
jgi:hypothetical protein